MLVVKEPLSFTESRAIFVPNFYIVWYDALSQEQEKAVNRNDVESKIRLKSWKNLRQLEVIVTCQQI